MKQIKVILGAGDTQYDGWISTDIDTLDITKESDYQKHFEPNTVDVFLMEHVLEHLSYYEAKKALHICHRYLKPDAYIRVAVPDAEHPDIKYFRHIIPNEYNGHKEIYTYTGLWRLMTNAGFMCMPIEYWSGERFNSMNYRDEDGYILRCAQNDPRNQDGKLNYTSIIVDGYKL